MTQRVLTGLVLAPLALLIIVKAPPWLFVLVLLAVIERCLYEYFRIVRSAGFKTVPVIGYVAAGALCVAPGVVVYRPESQETIFLVVIPLSFALPMLLGLWWPSEPRHYLAATTSTIFGIFYIGFSLSLLVLLRFATGDYDGRTTVLLFLVVWADDLFAFAVGRWIGRAPLIPRISPKKTVAGSLAGLAGSILVGYAFARVFWQTVPTKDVILLTALIAVVGQVGDLVESALKRAGEVKDSGNLLPGHGGLLDRMDSLIPAVPAVMLALVLAPSWHL
ncbi:MAG: phosphatidate cytidylyltransferase [Terriglobia bacterium]|jgi:phosphatidate cytidylyltransferase